MEAKTLEALSSITDILGGSEVIDLTVLLENGIPRWPSHPHLVIDQTVTHSHDGYYCQSVSMPEHCGTHVDAPFHVHSDLSALTIEHVRPDALIGRCTVINLSARDWKPGETATLDDLQAAMKAQQAELRTDDIVLINFGWLKKYWTAGADWKYYAMNQPGLSEDTADFFIQQKVRAVGTDTIAVGTPVNNGVSDRCFYHEKVLRNEIYLMECLDRLEQLPAHCLFVSAPLKIYRGSGSPIRALAFVPKA